MMSVIKATALHALRHFFDDDINANVTTMLENSNSADEYRPDEAAGSNLLRPDQAGVENITQNNVDNNEDSRYADKKRRD